MKKHSSGAAVLSALALAAAAGGAVAQDTQWQVTFDIQTGALTGQQFTGTLAYDQASLVANFTDGRLFAEFGEFNFSATLPNGVVLNLNDDPFAVAIFSANELTGLDYLGDNGVEALNTFDLTFDLNNEFSLFLDPDATPDGTGTFSFERLTATDVITRGYNSTNASIDDTDISFQPSNPAAADTNFEGELAVSVDDDDGPGSFNPRQILIRFNDIIGNGPDQIPLGSTIIGAVFRVEIISPGNGFTAHRLLTDWDVNTVTWNSFVDGVQADDIEAVATPDFSVVGAGNGLLSIDLTPSLNAFVNGADNFGFALLPLPGGTDGVDFFTSEAPEGLPLLFNPPLLTITLGDGTIRTFQEGVNGYTGTADTTLRQVGPDTNFAALNTTSIDLNDGGFESQYILRFDDIFGTGPGQINPATDTIVSATIRTRVTSEGANVSVYELAQPFEETRATWNTFGNGIDHDAVAPFRANNPAEVNTTPVLTINTALNVNGAPNPAYDFSDPASPFITFDLTSSFQGWLANPASNNGLAFLPESTNGFDFDAEGNNLPPIGPQLFVSFIPPDACPADFNGDTTPGDIFDLFDFLAALDGGLDFNGDTSPADIFDLFDFLAVLDQGCP